MLKSLKIKNFKSHPDSILEFSFGINAIIGRPNHGKTNIVRALLKLLKNRPLGGDFLFSGLDKGVVEILAEFDDAIVKLENTIFTAKDGKSQVKDARYSLGERGFETMNKGVPDLIKKAINLTDLNIQSQLDQPFLITSSAGKIAETVNRITRQDKADELEKRLTTKVNSTNKEIKFIEAEVKSKTDELKLYKKVDDLDSIVSTVETFQEELEENEERLDNIIQLSEALTETVEEIEYLEGFLSVGELIGEVEKLQESLQEKNEIYNLLIEYYNINEDISELELLVNPLSKIIKEIEVEEEKVELNNNKYNLLCDYNKEKLEEEELIDEKKIFMGKYINELKRRKICPTCFSLIDIKIIEKIRKEL